MSNKIDKMLQDALKGAGNKAAKNIKYQRQIQKEGDLVIGAVYKLMDKASPFALIISLLFFWNPLRRNLHTL